MKVKKIKLIIYNVAVVFIIAIVAAVNVVAVYYEQALLLFLGTVGGSATEVSLSSYASDEDLRAAQEELVRDMVDEGTVLLKNDGALPLNGDEAVTLFGQSSVHWANEGTGSSAMGDVSGIDLKQALEQAGFSVNQTVWK